MSALTPGRPLRVLVAHNAYQQRGGEDFVVDAEIGLLQGRGHQVELFSRRNDELAHTGRIAAAVQAVWSARTVADLTHRITAFKPDLIHAHNTFPLISPSLYAAAARAGIPVVQTLHNFRLLCPQAMFLRDGRICEDCLGKLPWRGVVHRCYRGSVAQTAVVASMLGIHRAMGTYRDQVTRYIAQTEFSWRKFIEGGLPADRISIKPNFVDVPAGMEGERSGGLFVGRLSGEKGIQVLLGALDSVQGSAIDVVGVGPEEARLRGHYGVRLHGWMESARVLERMRAAAFLVAPSIWYEGFPRVIVEAFACALPVIASRLGSIAEIIRDGETGLLFEPGDAVDLARKMAWAEANPAAMRELGMKARRDYEEKYTPARNYQQLIAIYAQAISEHSRATTVA